MARQGRLFAMACLVLAMALWGSSFIALKFAFAELPPMWVIFGRMALGSLVFLLAWRWRGRLDYRPGDWRYLLALAACEPCLYFIFEALALQHTSATQAGIAGPNRPNSKTRRNASPPDPSLLRQAAASAPRSTDPGRKGWVCVR